MSDEKILVVGAGMAGLSAARILHDAGYVVTLLEGRDRIGGRVWTSRKWADAPMDLGGSWIHGVRGNPLTALADEIDAPRLPTDYDSAVLYDADGRLLGDRDWVTLDKFAKQAEKAVNAVQNA